MGARALPSRGSIENIPAELHVTTVSTHLETHARTNSKRGDFTVGFGWVCYRWVCYRIWVGLLSDTYSGSKTRGEPGYHLVTH